MVLSMEDLYILIVAPEKNYLINISEKESIAVTNFCNWAQQEAHNLVFRYGVAEKMFRRRLIVDYGSNDNSLRIKAWASDCMQVFSSEATTCNHQFSESTWWGFLPPSSSKKSGCTILRILPVFVFATSIVLYHQCVHSGHHTFSPH